jgi:hypothetical protein
MDTTRYPNACYNMLLSLDNAVMVTWATHINTLLFHFGFGYVWISQEVGNAQYCFNVFTQRVQDCNFQEWCANKGASSKLVLYNEFKSLQQPDTYLSCILNKWHLYSLCRFRTSAHKLEIELGRHNIKDWASVQILQPLSKTKYICGRRWISFCGNLPNLCASSIKTFST